MSKKKKYDKEGKCKETKRWEQKKMFCNKRENEPGRRGVIGKRKCWRPHFKKVEEESEN